MNNIYQRNAFTVHVLIPPASLTSSIPQAGFSCRQNKGEISFLAPLCGAERGWGEFMRLYD
jgi:hypothetical protein